MTTNTSLQTLEQAWIKLMADILRDGRHVEDAYLELEGVTVSFGFDKIDALKRYPDIAARAKEMHAVFFTTKANAFGHSYGAAIKGPNPAIDDPVESVASVLAEKPTSRQAVLTFSPYPEPSGRFKVPCINNIVFLIRGGSLDVIYTARGQDIYLKFPLDAMCIAEFGLRVAARTGVKPGTIRANICSAHVYDHDIEAAQRMIRQSYHHCVILTGNAEKYRGYEDELKSHGIDLLISSEEIPEIQAETDVEVVKAKARSAYEKFGRPVFVDDMSLGLDAYPAFPGPGMKYVWRQLGVEGLQSLLCDKPKSGTITCRLCAFDGCDYVLVEGMNRGYFDFARPVANPKMPLNSIFVGEGYMIHRDRAVKKLIDLYGSSKAA